MFASLALGMDAPGYSISSSRGLGSAVGMASLLLPQLALAIFSASHLQFPLSTLLFFKLLKSSRQFVY